MAKSLSPPSSKYVPVGGDARTVEEVLLGTILINHLYIWSVHRVYLKKTISGRSWSLCWGRAQEAPFETPPSPAYGFCPLMPVDSACSPTSGGAHCAGRHRHLGDRIHKQGGGLECGLACFCEQSKKFGKEKQIGQKGIEPGMYNLIYLF